ncbi:MAG: YitT family protein [Lachnospiraceae bacterium]|nr:YitT family protein [Lachnospiraceae bacterium]
MSDTVRISRKEMIREFALLTLAVLIIAAAVFFFLVPSQCMVSSISGLAILLTNFTPLSVAQLTMILNVALLIVGFITCGNEFGIKTVYTSIMLPLFIGVFEKLLPHYTSLTGDPALDVVCYIFTVSVGLAMLFNRNASSGGLDIVAKVLNKYLHVDLGKAMSAAGMCIALSSALVYDKKIVILSILGTYLNGIVLDNFIFDQSLKRRVCIVSDKEEEIRLFILKELHSGASIYHCYGALHLKQRNEIITIVDKHEYQKLMTYLEKTDPKAFVTVYKVSNMRYVPKGPGYGSDV